MSRSFSLYVIRPYPTRIRTKVFAALESIGGVFRDDWIAEPGTNDLSVIERLEHASPDVLLCPFNPHQDTMGHDVNGVATLEKLTHHNLDAVPVLMPVTNLGKPRCLRLLEKANIPDKQRILVIEQKHYEGDELAEFIQAHLESCASTASERR